jgi:hypothetical protein
MAVTRIRCPGCGVGPPDPVAQGVARAVRTLAAGDTAKFHDIAAAQAAGYNVQFPAGCASSAEGGQGFHWINNGLVDDEINLLEPELVMYEPQPGGSMRLVGVDYVVPYVEGSTAPTLLGRDFAHLPDLGVWAIHIWAWAPNENGMFAAWNPAVSCENA